MFFLNDDFSTDAFLHDYWQKKARVIRRALVDFVDPIDEHDLAGLAQEEVVDSRIVSNQGGKWLVHHGPFNDFEAVCQGKWTLLVQAVDRYINDIDDLMEVFSFVPYWRMDDVMISFAVTGAGVGAHTDQYDVFLIQGAGKRRWRVGPPNSAKQHHPHKDLQQITEFHPTIDVVLEPGDILYIPPGWPHDGVAIEDCLTYSIGFRAPTQQDLIQQLADTVAEQHAGSSDSSQRYADPELALQAHPSQVTQQSADALREMLIRYLNSPQGDHALLSMLSAQHLTPLDEPSPIPADALLTYLEDGCEIRRTPGVKPLYYAPQSSDQFSFYINGEVFSCPVRLKPVLLELFTGEILSINSPGWDVDDIALLELLAILITKGYWELGN